MNERPDLTAEDDIRINGIAEEICNLLASKGISASDGLMAMMRTMAAGIFEGLHSYGEYSRELAMSDIPRGFEECFETMEANRAAEQAAAELAAISRTGPLQ